jgi:hypothetical protein
MKIGESIGYLIYVDVFFEINQQVKIGITIPMSQFITTPIHDLVTNAINLIVNENR